MNLGRTLVAICLAFTLLACRTHDSPFSIIDEPTIAPVAPGGAEPASPSTVAQIFDNRNFRAIYWVRDTFWLPSGPAETQWLRLRGEERVDTAISVKSDGSVLLGTWLSRGIDCSSGGAKPSAFSSECHISRDTTDRIFLPTVRPLLEGARKDLLRYEDRLNVSGMDAFCYGRTIGQDDFRLCLTPDGVPVLMESPSDHGGQFRAVLAALVEFDDQQMESPIDIGDGYVSLEDAPIQKFSLPPLPILTQLANSQE